MRVLQDLSFAFQWEVKQEVLNSTSVDENKRFLFISFSSNMCKLEQLCKSFVFMAFSLSRGHLPLLFLVLMHSEFQHWVKTGFSVLFPDLKDLFGPLKTNYDSYLYVHLFMSICFTTHPPLSQHASLIVLPFPFEICRDDHHLACSEKSHF